VEKELWNPYKPRCEIPLCCSINSFVNFNYLVNSLSLNYLICSIGIEMLLELLNIFLIDTQQPKSHPQFMCLLNISCNSSMSHRTRNNRCYHSKITFNILTFSLDRCMNLLVSFMLSKTVKKVKQWSQRYLE
jgi:hypothetical protein